MWKWLLPKSTNFFDYFEKHIDLVIQAAEVLQTLVSSDTDFVDSAKKIKDLEHQADELTRQCVKELHTTFITPFQRHDIHRLISSMDDVIDFAEETSQRIITYRIQTMNPEAAEFANILVLATKELGKVIVQLRNLKKIGLVQHSLKEVHRLETEGDEVYLRAVGRLFEQEGDIRLIIKWKGIYENLEEAIDACQDVANIIEGVILESN